MEEGYEMKCGAVLHFSAIGHKDHYCIEEVDLFHLNAEKNHGGIKHRCICGLKWTNDKALAEKGKTWSQELDITPGRKSTSEVDCPESDQAKEDQPN